MESRNGAVIVPAGCGCDSRDPSGTEAMPDARAPKSYVYALGRIQPRFSSLSVEKEFAQVASRTDGSGQTDAQMMSTVLAKPENRYLARRVCWVMSIENLETYLLIPREPSDLDLLIDSVRGSPRLTDVDLVIGVRGPIASPRACNGLQLPMVMCDQVYSFDIDKLLSSIPRPIAVQATEFGAVAEELFYRIMLMADNAGALDEHRALNYLAARDRSIYAAVAAAYGRNESFSGVEVRTSRLSGARKILDVIFSFTNRATDVTQKNFVRVDVTEEFPFLVTKMSPFVDF
jgi:hypothetical protein